MTDLDLVSRSLARVRGELSPSSVDKARLRAVIIVPPTLPIADGGVFAPAPLSRWVALRMTGKLGLSLGALLLGAGVGIGFWWGNEPGARASSVPVGSRALASGSLAPADGRSVAARSLDEESHASADEGAGVRGESRSSESASAFAASDPANASPAVPVAPARARSPRPTARAQAGSAAPAQTKSTESRKASVDIGLESELALLRRVERAIRANDPALALALLAELDAAFPDTRLAEERLAARRIAECRAGQPDAQQSARRFILEHGSSVYRQRMGLACGVDQVEQGEIEQGRAPMKNDESPDTHGR